MSSRIGNYTLRMDACPSILGHAAIGSKKEGEGPQGSSFDYIHQDSYLGQKTWEKAESQLQKEALQYALRKAGCQPNDLQYVFAGDLLNQCISSTFGLMDFGVPFIGLYGACSTMAESLSLAAIFAESGACNKCGCVTSSHFCTAERQYRFPLEYGSFRAPTAQWTATASGSCILGKGNKGPYIRAVTFGTIEDLGIKDANNMGAAMAPAAATTIKHFFDDTGAKPEQFDLILTGDLGETGSAIVKDLLGRDNIQLDNHNDCGLLLYDRETQGVNAGGSGCGCSASVLCGTILNQMEEGKLNDILFIATGALLSPTSSQQGQSIPGIAHLVHISTTNWEAQNGISY